ncbi:YybH family protein [Paraburkholderia sp. GAS334]|uniref:YybH family protein n=1 Tax=Paraburkholderia sp. GAS334 TaxID=3035131 RepID=UPI003D1A8873
MSTIETTVKEVPSAASEALCSMESAWNAAALHWDVDGLTALYSDDATMFAGRPGMATGTQGVREYFASYIGMLSSTQLELVEQAITELGPDAFLAQGYGNFRFTLTSGKPSAATLRTTWLLVRRSGRWMIAHHHFSATPEVPPVPQ